MNAIKSLIWKPSPEEQKRKCTSLIRSNTRKLERDIQQLKALEIKTRNHILQASKRAQRNPSQSIQANQETRLFAKELLRIRKQNARLATSKAQLQSVQMQVNEAFSIRKIEGSIKASTGIMKDVNSLIRLPQLTNTMKELSQELIKAGVIEEMVGDSLPDQDVLEDNDEEAELEINKVLGEILKERLSPSTNVPKEQATTRTSFQEQEDEENEENEEELLSQMRGRLEALKS